MCDIYVRFLTPECMFHWKLNFLLFCYFYNITLMTHWFFHSLILYTLTNIIHSNTHWVSLKLISHFMTDLWLRQYYSSDVILSTMTSTGNEMSLMVMTLFPSSDVGSSRVANWDWRRPRGMKWFSRPCILSLITASVPFNTTNTQSSFGPSCRSDEEERIVL